VSARLGLLRKENVCSKCQKQFRKLEDLMSHEQLYHEAKSYDCLQCKQSFGGMEQMRDHVKKFHSYNKMKKGQD